MIIEFLVGISPLLGIAFWGWDTFLVLMQHFLALAISAAWLVLRFATLSREAVVLLSAKTAVAVLLQLSAVLDAKARG